MNTFNKDRLYAENEDLRERIAELEEVLQKLHKLGGLGLDKHKWIEDVLKGGDL